MPQGIEERLAENETTLLRRVARGEPSAVEALLRQHGNAVFRFVYHRNGERREDAQDVTQETFLAAVGLASTYDGSCSVLTWLCSLAKIKVADHLRREGRLKRVPTAMLVELDADGAAALSEFRQGEIMIDQALERLDAQAFIDGVSEHLSEDERESLLLHFVEGFSVAEMSKLLNRSPKGVESLLTRAKRNCREVAARWLGQ